MRGISKGRSRRIIRESVEVNAEETGGKAGGVAEGETLELAVGVKAG